MAAKHRVGIVGAGTSGVYLANLLLHQGHEVEVFERSPTPRTEGCGILLVQAGMKALQAGDPELCRRLIDLGAPVSFFEYRNLKGQVINSEPVTYEPDELPGLLIHRGAILSTLLEALPSAQLHLGAQFLSLDESAAGITAQFADGRQWQGDVLVGADGIYSQVRETVLPGVKPVYLGDIVWRGVVEDTTFCPDGGFILYVRGRGIYANFFDIGEGRTHWGFFTEAPQQPGEEGAPQPFDVAIPPQELAKLPDEPRAVIEATPPEAVSCRFSYDIDPLERLYAGRVVLMGDAGHAKSPTRARGMTAGFEDAIALCTHLTAQADVEKALHAFQEERLPIVHEYQRSSREISKKIGRK